MNTTTQLILSTFMTVAIVASCSKSPVKPTPAASGTTAGTGATNSTGTSMGTGSTTATGTGTTNTTAASPKMRYLLKASNPTNALRTTAEGTISWTSAIASPTMIKFEATRNGSEIEYKTTTAGSIDLMSSAAVYFGNFTIPAGTYNEIELKIQLKKGTAPALELNGTLSTSSGSIPVKVQINDFVEVKTEQHNVTTVDNDSLTSNYNI